MERARRALDWGTRVRDWVAFQAKYEADDELVIELLQRGYVEAHAPRITYFKRVAKHLRKRLGASRVISTEWACAGYVFAKPKPDTVVSIYGLKNASGIVENAGTSSISEADVMVYLKMCIDLPRILREEPEEETSISVERSDFLAAIAALDPKSFIGRMVAIRIGELPSVWGYAVGATDTEVKVEIGSSLTTVSPAELYAAR